MMTKNYQEALEGLEFEAYCLSEQVLGFEDDLVKLYDCTSEMEVERLFLGAAHKSRSWVPEVTIRSGVEVILYQLDFFYPVSETSAALHAGPARGDQTESLFGGGCLSLWCLSCSALFLYWSLGEPMEAYRSDWSIAFENTSLAVVSCLAPI